MYNQTTYRSNSRKKTIRLKGPFLFTAMLIVLSFCCVFAYDCLIAMPYFQTRDIQVSGNQFLTKKQILECANLTESENIVHLNLRKRHQRLIQNPWISSASIHRKFPNIITIEVAEKKPLANILLQDPLIIDARGYVIKKQAPSDPNNLPVVTGISYADLSQYDEPLSQKMRLIIRVLTEKKQTLGLLKNMNIGHVHIDTHFGITVWLNNHDGSEIEILLGTENFKNKFNRLTDIFTFFQNQKKKQQIEYIDITHLDRIILRPLEINNSDSKEV
jgi:cell division protein FtsQ